MVNTVPLVKVDAAVRPYYVGVDVGGTGIKIGLLDDLGRTIAFDRMPTDEERGPEDAVQRISALIEQLIQSTGLANTDVAAVGLGTPGTMDIPAGMTLDPPNLPHWKQFPIRDRLRDACGLPVTYANDASAAAFGEYWVGSGRAFPSIVMLTLGTGVGGGIIVGDQTIDGENSHGGELGHIIVDSSETARVCSCGQRGHLEAYASATAVVARAAEALDSGRASSLSRRREAGETLNGLMLAEEAEAGDELSIEVVLETAHYLAIGIVTILHTIDPGAIILGGAMNFGGNESTLGRRFLAAITDEVRGKAFPVVAQRMTIEFASLGGDAGYIGAAGIARAAHRKRPRPDQ